VLLTCAGDQELLLLPGKRDQFGVLNHLVFLSQNPAVLLVVDVSTTAISYVVASVSMTLSRS
jgi:hypothetical protein